MPDDTPEHYRPHDALAEAERVAERLVGATQVPKSFLLAMAALVATLFSLFHVVPMSVSLSLLLLAIPMGAWYYLLMRARPKPRTMLKHSGPYVGYALLLSLIFQASRFWEGLLWWEVSVKWVLTFALSWFLLSRLLDAEANSRLRDASEHPF
ncbi:hypothetical protein [Paeniglutamicibacter sp. NPDC091659]|uniref:hypothetical protein n=1 Tax=Paeniglutamicibacter sp. NPDC091659 TaxID=3364389 RepID=UPI0037FF8100